MPHRSEIISEFVSEQKRREVEIPPSSTLGQYLIQIICGSKNMIVYNCYESFISSFKLSGCKPLLRDKFPIIIDQEPILGDIIHDLKAGVPIAVISAKFHNTVAEMVSEVCRLIRERDSLNKVALSGGVFQNIYLLKRTLRHLQREGFQTYIHHQVPGNDGGIALGQAVIASAKVSRPNLARRNSHVLSGTG